jgi:membrane protein DedA with SNARE-associated domain
VDPDTTLRRMEAADAGAARRTIPLTWLLAPIVVVTVVNFAGDIVGPNLITTHPTLQILLSPKNRYYILAAPQIGAITFFTVGFARLLLTDPLFFLIGRQHGDTAIEWAGRKLGDSGPMMDTALRWFEKAAPLVILIAPTSYLNLLAGATGMRLRLYVLLNLVGTGGRLAIFWYAGDWFHDEVFSVLDWVRQYQWWLIGLSTLLVAVQVWRQRGKGLFDSPADVAEEFAELEAEEGGGA